jgi:hypothetical protein
MGVQLPVQGPTIIDHSTEGGVKLHAVYFVLDPVLVIEVLLPYQVLEVLR